MKLNIINCNNFIKNLIFNYLTKINNIYIENDKFVTTNILFFEKLINDEDNKNNEIILTYSKVKTNKYFSFFEYFNILGFEPESSDKMFFLANALNNFILLQLNYNVGYPIILDPIQSIKQLLITNNSLSRFGDGELYTAFKGVAPYKENVKKFQKEFIDILKKNNNTNLYIGLCDIFNDKCLYFWDKKEYLYWFTKKWRTIIKQLIPVENYGNIYLNANISRVLHYPVIDPNKYFEYYCNLYLNKEIIVICNKEIMFKHLDNLLFPAKKIIFIIIKSNTCSIDEDFIYNNCLLYGKNKLILAFAGLFATYLANKISKIQDYRCIDSGSFYWERNIFSKDFIYSIDNIINKFYYKINSNLEYTDNNDFNKLTSCFVLDESKSLDFNLKIESIINPTFKIHFILPSYLKKFNKVKCHICIKTNILFTINTGINILVVDKNISKSLFFDFKKFEWYIEPKNYSVNNIKIEEITLKIIEIYDCK